MKNTILRGFLSSVSLFSILLMTISANAAPVRFSQVVQIVNAKPGKANTDGFTQLRLVNSNGIVAKTTGGDDDDKKTAAAAPPQQQDGRVITETRSDIVEDDTCDCAVIEARGPGFPKYALLGLAAIPFLFLIPHHDRDTPTPTGTPTTTPTGTPTGTPTETPTMTPTMTPTDTPTPMTPTPTPEPVPEPVTILLFGTGLAGIGVAARRRLRRKDEENTEE